MLKTRSEIARDVWARRKAEQGMEMALAEPKAEAEAEVEVEVPVVEVVLPPSRVASRNVRLVVKTDGTMACLDSPCLCGKGKREWHAICLKEAVV